MPVYNAQDYLAEAIESIVNQTLSFKENVVIHLIDDASSDKSLDICKEYEEKYPDNIIVTHFETNGGVSRARNYGIKQCRYNRKVIVGFVDSDDCLDQGALEAVQSFFDAHKDINLASARIQYFGARDDEHKSNWRFEEKEVVNIKEDYNFPQYYIGGVFLRKKALRRLKFDEGMSFWEDAMAISKVIMKEGKYGLVKDALYYYRKMEDESSLVDRAWKKKERYTTFLEDGYMALMKYCKLRKLKVIPYIQYLVAYHLRLFLLESNREAVLAMISEEDMPEFKRSLGMVLENIEDEVIVKLNTALPVVEALLSLKYNKKVRAKKTFTEDDLIFSYKDFEICRLSERSVRIFGILKDAYKPELEGMWRGRFSTPVYAMTNEDYIFAEHNGERIDTVRYPCKKKLYILDELARNYKNTGFAVAIPQDWETVRFGININGVDIMLNEISSDEVGIME